MTQLSVTSPVTGCVISQRGAGANMSVDVAAGSVLVGNVAASVAAVNEAIAAADATYDRIDAVVADSTGAVSVLTGDLAGNYLPDTTGYAVLGTVYVLNQADPNYTGTIVAAYITSTNTASYALVHTSPYKVSNLWYPPIAAGSSDNDIGGLNNMLLQPLFVGKTLPVKAIGFGLKTNYAAAAVVRLGVYSDDGAGNLTLLVDAGTVATSSGAGASLLTAAISQTLTPGWWWLAIVQQVNHTTGAIYEFATLPESPLGISDPLGTNVTGYMFAGVSGALPTNPAVIASTWRNVGVWVQAT